jgi:hypothetical protein
MMQLTRYADGGWRATFFVAGREHSATRDTSSAWERTTRSDSRVGGSVEFPWRAVQRAALDALARGDRTARIGGGE